MTVGSVHCFASRRKILFMEFISSSSLLREVSIERLEPFPCALLGSSDSVTP